MNTLRGVYHVENVYIVARGQGKRQEFHFRSVKWTPSLTHSVLIKVINLKKNVAKNMLTNVFSELFNVSYDTYHLRPWFYMISYPIHPYFGWQDLVSFILKTNEISLLPKKSMFYFTHGKNLTSMNPLPKCLFDASHWGLNQMAAILKRSFSKAFKGNVRRLIQISLMFAHKAQFS